MKYKPYDYQEFAKNHIIKNNYCGLFLDMGLGKTVTTLTAINELIFDRFEIEKVLVIAPLRVAEDTWVEEVFKWDHLKYLKISKVLGSEKERKEALNKKANIYVTNRENVVWLISYLGGAFPFDMLIVDELSSFKSSKSARFKALKQVRSKIKRIVGLTGTPSPNSLIDLWSQIYLLDLGERLGKNITTYKNKYFIPNRTNGQIIFDYKLQKGSENIISESISDICISMKAKDYLKLPEKIFRNINIKLPDKIKKQHDEFEKEQVLKLMETEIDAVNAAGLSNKLLQFSNGAVYDENKDYYEIHNLKIEKLEEILEFSYGQAVLVFYSFKHDLERIEKKLKKYKPKKLESKKDIEDWNKGKVKFLLAHPKSAGYGINLQQGGRIIVWFGFTWSLELYEQANARLYRQGQEKPVIIYNLICKETLDEDVLLSLENKKKSQEAILEAIKARIRKYKIL